MTYIDDPKNLEKAENLEDVENIEDSDNLECAEDLEDAHDIDDLYNKYITPGIMYSLIVRLTLVVCTLQS